MQVKLHLIEFMDSQPVGGAEVRLRFKIVPFFMDRTILEPPEGQTQGPGAPTHIDVRTAHPELAQTLELNAETDAAGRAAFDGDPLAPAFAAVLAKRLGHRSAVDVEATVRYAVTFHGIAFRERTLDLAITDPAADIDSVIVVDLAKSIVGHTTEDHVTLWFQIHGTLAADHELVCQVGPADASPLEPNLPGAVRRVAVALLPGNSGAATVELDGLASGRAFAYVLGVRRAGAASSLINGWTLAQGTFATAAAGADRLSLVYASCHLPEAPQTLNRWQALARRDDYEMLLLIGDQVYGDGLDGPSVNDADWPQLYINLYNKLWAYQPMRQVLRRTATYMMLDDHEVDDDLGTVMIPEPRVAGATAAYLAFQQSHNPGGVDSATFSYHYRRGPAAFYVMDVRTARGKDPQSPVIGKAEMGRFRDWCASAEARDADVIFVVTPVPLAILPFAQIEELAKKLAERVGSAAGAAAGALAGAVIAGPLGAAAGAVIGGFLGGEAAERVYDHELLKRNDPDFKDAWTFRDNVRDLVPVVDALFDLANDIGPSGAPGNRPRAVFALGGDYHLGAQHVIRSSRTDGGHDHRNNPTILQLTSSPISVAPVDSQILIEVAGHVQGEHLDVAQLLNLALDHPDPLGDAPADFLLDPDNGGHYRVQLLGLLVERNFGRVSVERVGTGRKYRVRSTTEGESRTLVQHFDIDLDARPVTMTAPAFDVLAAEGRVASLRVNDVGGGYGPPSDHLDAEVIVHLDAEEGRAFGFTLRPGADQQANAAMLDLLRQALAADRKVRIDYRRTGLRNGVLIRATVNH